METRQDLLNRHGWGAPYNPKAWAYFVRQAQGNLVYFRSVGQSWVGGAREWRERVLTTHPLIEAAKSYGYSHYRGTAKSGVWGLSVPLDRQAAELWQSFGV